MRTVLIADSNTSFATMISEELKRLGGYNVVITGSGPLALERCAVLKPHLAVIDGELPDTSLPELIAEMRQYVPSLPVVLMPVDRADVPSDPPVQGVLTKPFFLPDLTALIKSLLGSDPDADTQPTLPVTEATQPTKSARQAVVRAVSTEAPLRSRLSVTGMLNPPTPAAPISLNDDKRRAVESQLESMSRALRDEPVFISQLGRVLAMAPRLSTSAATMLARVVAKAWASPDPPPEVIRFEGNSEINRYMLYSVLVVDDLALSVAMRVRIPLPIVRRVTRHTAAELARIISR